MMSQQAVSMPESIAIMETSGRCVKPAEYARRQRASISKGDVPITYLPTTSSIIFSTTAGWKGTA